MGGLTQDIADVVAEYEAKGWTYGRRGRGYPYLICPCGSHGPKTVHLTPSDPNYARNLRGWLRRQHCPGEAK